MAPVQLEPDRILEESPDQNQANSAQKDPSSSTLLTSSNDVEITNPFAVNLRNQQSIPLQTKSKLRASSNKRQRANEIDDLAQETQCMIRRIPNQDTQLVLNNMLDILQSISKKIDTVLHYITKEPESTASLTTFQPSQPSQNRTSSVTRHHSKQPAAGNSRQQQGKEQAPLAPMTYSQVVAKIPVGRRADTFEMKKQNELHQQNPVKIPDEIPTETIKKLTREPKPPQHHQITALRYSRMAPRQKINAKEWRKTLQKHSISPFSVLFPQQNTLELVIPAEQESQTKAFFAALNRQEEDVNPFARRDGQDIPLPPQIIQRYIQNRIQMLKYEFSMVAARYIEMTIQQGLQLLPQPQQPDLLQQLQETMKLKRMEIMQI